MHTVFALLCFVVVIHWLIFPYPSGLLHWHCGNLTIAPVPAKQPWWIWINTSCEFIMNVCITTTKQSTTKPCAYFLGFILQSSRTGYRWGPPITVTSLWARWRLKSPALRLFSQPFIQAQIKRNIQALRHWSLFDYVIMANHQSPHYIWAVVKFNIVPNVPIALLCKYTYVINVSIYIYKALYTYITYHITYVYINWSNT